MVVLKEIITDYLVYVKGVRGFSYLSIQAYRRELEKFMRLQGELRDVNQITIDDIRMCIAYLSKKGLSAVSINHFIVALRSFFEYCRKFGIVEKNIAKEIRTLKTPKKLVSFLTQAQLDTLCMQPLKKEILWQTRDAAILEFFYSTGCRISEVTNAKMSRFCQEGKALLITGKGEKDRYVFIGDDSKRTLDNYFIDRAARFPECDTDVLFLNQRGKPLTTAGIRYIINRYTGEEGTNFHVAPHTLRHTFATAILNNGADIRIVQELLGHSDISTTQRYTHVTMADKIKAYNDAFPHAKGTIKRSDSDEE